MAHRCALAEAEEYGEFRTSPHGQYDVSERWRAKCPTDRTAGIVRDSEYEEWPRGRVVYNANDQRFILYADAQILSRSVLLTIIAGKAS